jgi:hypothetical protein
MEESVRFTVWNNCWKWTMRGTEAVCWKGPHPLIQRDIKWTMRSLIVLSQHLKERSLIVLSQHLKERSLKGVRATRLVVRQSQFV